MTRSIPNREVRKVWKHFPLGYLYGEREEREHPRDDKGGERGHPLGQRKEEYVCEYCGETFDRYQVLAGHVSAHHSNGG